MSPVEQLPPAKLPLDVQVRVLEAKLEVSRQAGDSLMRALTVMTAKLTTKEVEARTVQAEAQGLREQVDVLLGELENERRGALPMNDGVELVRLRQYVRNLEGTFRQLQAAQRAYDQALRNTLDEAIPF
jgi:hypothetical protein